MSCIKNIRTTEYFISILTSSVKQALKYSHKNLIIRYFTYLLLAAFRTSAALTGFHVFALKFNKHFEKFS